MQLITRLNEIIDRKHLLKHMFYQAWSKGELSQDILKRYSEEYYAQVESFPRFVSRVHTNCPEIAARKVLLNNLIDEEIHGTDHPALWMQFAEKLGSNAAFIKNTEKLPETKRMVDAFYALADRDWRDGLCALYAYEYQVPAVSESKIAGLKAFYGISDEKALEFFTAHQAYDVEHSNQVAQLIERFCEPERAEQATKEATIALWQFLDGMCHISGIHC